MNNEEIKRFRDKIAGTRIALNNDKTELWNREGIFSDCTNLRYLTVLYWAQINPISNDKSFTIYQLNKISKQLYLNFVKDKRAKSVYIDLVKRKEVSLKTKDHVDYFSISKNGIDLCNDRLDVLLYTVNDLKEICI